MSDWGQGAKNNNVGWGQGASRNTVGWGDSHKKSWAGDTEIVGSDGNVPVNTVAPVISGTALVGNTLTTTNGTWTSDTGVTGYLYQWRRNGVAISGATNNTYVLTFADAGANITCAVAATDLDGTSAFVSSNSILFRAFEFTINTTNISTGSTANNQFALPLISSLPLNAFIDWGDGSTDIVTTFNQPERIHTYTSAGTYTIKITGALSGWQFANTGDRLKILNIASWGVLNVSTIFGFWGCANLTATATDAPTISTNNLSLMFSGCTNFNGAVGNWNVSDVTSMNSMFSGCTSFNQNIGNWNVSNVTNMGSMFAGAGAFNQNIGNWNVANVTNMFGMFQSAAAFNQNIGNWNVSNVTNFTNFMLFKTNLNYSASNLDAIYNGWSSRPVQPNISINFGTIRYTSASSAGRAILTGAPNNWSITDGGII